VKFSWNCAKGHRNGLKWTQMELHIDEIMESCLARLLNSFLRRTRDSF
jgi:hypothetical protein